MEGLRPWVIRAADCVLSLPVLLAAFLLRSVRQLGIQRLPVCRSMLSRVGVFPIRDHYYEPLFRTDRLTRPLDRPRPLPGIEFDTDGQLQWLARFRYRDELDQFPRDDDSSGRFYFHNGMFESGDAEYFYSLLRTVRPRRLVEIGAGYSTLLARAALDRNRSEDDTYRPSHVCIEPFENPWLEASGASIERTPLERLDRSVFDSLEANDVLFIDSSHMIRPQGDVLVEFLEILPSLGPGVFVHVHDIFTPRDYPTRWVQDEVRFWNEQYLLEAFLSGSARYQVIGALNHLAHEHPDELAAACPVFAEEVSHREPGSFWMQAV